MPFEKATKKTAATAKRNSKGQFTAPPTAKPQPKSGADVMKSAGATKTRTGGTGKSKR